MQCKEVTKHMVVYHELEEADRQRVDTHLKHCTACYAQYTRWQQQKHWLATLPDAVQPQDGAGRLTDRIMAAVENSAVQARHQSVWFTWWANLFYAVPMRYAMGAVSLSIVFFFLYEQYRFPMYQEQPSPEVALHAEPEDGTLNSGAYYKMVKEYKDKGLWYGGLVEFYSCMKACVEQAPCTTCRQLYPGWFEKYQLAIHSLSPNGKDANREAIRRHKKTSTP